MAGERDDHFHKYLSERDRPHHGFGGHRGPAVDAHRRRAERMGHHVLGGRRLRQRHNDKIYSNWWQPWGGWAGEHEMGGWAHKIDVGKWGDGRLELFSIGTNNCIYHHFQVAPNAGWSGEYLLCGATYGALTAAAWGDGRLELFFALTGNQIHHKWWGADGWSGEFALPGLAKDLATVTWPNGRVELFYIGTNDATYHQWWTGSAWSGEYPF